MLRSRARWILIFSLALAGCGDDDAAPPDAGPADGGMRDTGPGVPDTGPRDAGMRDAGPRDAGCTDCGIVALAAGFFHTCALRENGTTICWGRNTDGELGDNRMRHGMDCGMGLEDDCSSTFVRTLGIDDAVEISAHGGPSTCVRNEAGVVTCWGLEWADNPAFGGPERHFEPFSAMIDDAIDLGNGFRHMCAVRTGGTVTCQGTNTSGQLGDGSRMDRRAPVAVMDLTGVLDVETGAGSAVSCARTRGEVWCWGANDLKQLGDGAVMHETCTAGLTTYDCSSTPVQVDGLAEVTQISIGGSHVCAVRPDGTVACWGSNYFGQLGDGTLEDRDVPTDVPGVTDAVEVDTGSGHTCIRRMGGEVVCFGSNDRGRLGDGDSDHMSCSFGAEVVDCSPTAVAVTGLDDAVDLALGLSHACALRETGGVVCWGTNTFRQLGDGSRDDHDTPTPVLGLE